MYVYHGESEVELKRCTHSTTLADEMKSEMCSTSVWQGQESERRRREKKKRSFSSLFEARKTCARCETMYSIYDKRDDKLRAGENGYQDLRATTN